MSGKRRTPREIGDMGHPPRLHFRIFSEFKARLDLLPKKDTVAITLPSGADWKGGTVSIEPK